MATATVQHNQCLLDIAIQYCGNDSAFFDLAIINGLSPTADLVPGQVLVLPPVIDNAMVAFMKAKGHVPATYNKAALAIGPDAGQGLEYWSIEYDFTITE